MNRLINDPYELTSVQLMNYLIMLLPIASPTKQSLLTTNNLKQRCNGLLNCLEQLAQN
jgi:Lon protease-like protein